MVDSPKDSLNSSVIDLDTSQLEDDEEEEFEDAEEFEEFEEG
jgi:hypothetical protein